MRSILNVEQAHPDIRDQLGGNSVYVDEIRSAVASHPVVVVGMAQNPFVRKARKLLVDKGVNFEYFEYGSYFSKWRERLAIKMWTGFPTFPQIFVAGTLVGGYSELKTLLAEGGAELDFGQTVEQKGG